MSKNILITGSEGQIGSRLTKKLIKSNFKVFGIDIKEKSQKYNYFKCNLLDEKQIQNLPKDLEQIEVLVHLTSIVESSRNIIKNTEKTFLLNTCTILKLLPRLKNLKQIIFSSSMMVYGIPSQTPILETHPTNPINIYGISKLYTENLLKIFSNSNVKIKVSILRFTSLYGPGKYSGSSSSRAIPKFISVAKKNISPTIYGKINEKRDYLFINDAIQAIELCIMKPFNGTINIGSGQSITIFELAKLICKLTKSLSDPIVIDENKNCYDDYLLNIDKAKDLIGFKPKMKLTDGLKEEINYSKL
tara:strand:+ start:120 stop:1028 length:909 start_codon:yes stop_codon:yes gene_type:complete